MPSTVEQLSPTRVKITVEVPFADLKPSMDKAYGEIARSITIPGFRRGKVPPMIIDQRIGRGTVIQEAFNDSWQRFYSDAVQQNKLTPLAQPEVEVTKLNDGDLIEFTAEVDIRPDFDLPELASLSATVDALDVPEDLIDDQLETLRKRFGARQTVDRPAEDGDLVTLSLVARKDGEQLPDATADDLDYTVGSGQMLDGLDEAVTGLSAGESAHFSSTLVGGPHKDDEADVEVTVGKVAVQELPELDDDFAQEASEFDTVSELRDNIRQRLEAMARLEQASQARDAVLASLISQIDIEVPAGLLETEQNARREQIQSQLAQAGLTLSAYLAESDEEQTEDEFWAGIDERAEQALTAQIVLDKIADERQIGIGQDDLTQHILRKAQTDGVPPQQIADHLKEHPHHIEEYVLEIRRGKALAAVVEAATVTDSNGDRIELSGLQQDGTFAAEGELRPLRDRGSGRFRGRRRANERSRE